MAAYVGEFSLSLPPVGHPHVHLPLPAKSVSATAWPGGVRLLMYEHVLGKVHWQTNYCPVQSGDMFRGTAVETPTTFAEIAYLVPKTLYVAIYLVPASLALRPSEPDLAVQPDDRPAYPFRSLSPDVQNLIWCYGGHSLDANRQGLDEPKVATLAKQVKRLTVDELFDLVVRRQTGGSVDVLGDPAAPAPDEPHDLGRVRRRWDQDGDGTARLDLYANAAPPRADRHVDLPLARELQIGQASLIGV